MSVAISEMTLTAGTDSADSINLSSSGSGATGPQNVQGAGGDDRIQLNGSAGLANGGEGNDTLIGNAQNDTLKGGTGDDLMRGEGGSDSMWGQDGNDTMAGGAGNDRMVGGEDSDVLIGGNGDDTLTGDGKDLTDSADIFVFDMNDGNDRVLDFDQYDSVELIGDGSVSYNMTVSGTTVFLTYGTTTVTFLNAAAVLDATDISFVDGSEYPFA